MEVLISMTLLLLVVNVVYGLLLSGVSSYMRTSAGGDVRSQLRIGMNRMERELREARWLTTNTQPSILKFRMPNHQTDTDKAIPITFSRDKIISYYVEDGKLMRRIYDIPFSGFDSAGPNRGDPSLHYNEGFNSIARNIDSLELSYLPPQAEDNSYKTAVMITLKGSSPSTGTIVLKSTVQIRAQRGW